MTWSAGPAEIRTSWNVIPSGREFPVGPFGRARERGVPVHGETWDPEALQISREWFEKYRDESESYRVLRIRIARPPEGQRTFFALYDPDGGRDGLHIRLVPVGGVTEPIRRDVAVLVARWLDALPSDISEGIREMAQRGLPALLETLQQAGAVHMDRTFIEEPGG